MTKREMAAMSRRIQKLENKLGRKRDEIRDILGDLEEIVNNFNEADETLHTVFNNLQSARLELDGAADTMSRMV